MRAPTSARPDVATTERLADAVDNLIALVVRHQGEALWHGVALTPPQRVVLRVVSDEGALRLQDVAARLGDTQSKTSRAVAALRELGLVETVTDPADGRAIRITATDEGRGIVRERHARLVRAVADTFRDAEAQEQVRLAEMLERLEPLLRPASPPA